MRVKQRRFVETSIHKILDLGLEVVTFEVAFFINRRKGLQVL